MVTRFIPRPLFDILTGPFYMEKSSQLPQGVTYESSSKARLMAMGAFRIAAAALGAYALYRVNPSATAGRAAAALGACVLSVPSTALATAGYLFYSAGISGLAAYAAPSVKAVAIFAGYLTGGYFFSMSHDYAPRAGILDRFVFPPMALKLAAPIARLFAK
jgi:hypothetical protein